MNNLEIALELTKLVFDKNGSDFYKLSVDERTEIINTTFTSILNNVVTFKANFNSK